MTDREKLIEIFTQGCRDIAEAMGTPACSERFCKERSKNCHAEIIDHLLANGVTVQKHGRWELHNSGKGTCSECRMTTVAVWDDDNSLKYCPSCGAKMEG